MVEDVIERKLILKIPGFSMKKFERVLISRKDQLGGEVFDILFSLGDFSEFKDNMIAYKNSSNNSRSLDLSISGHQLK